MTKKLTRPHKKTGRPDSFHPLFVDRAFKLTLLGLTFEEVAHQLDVSSTAFVDMCRRHPELAAAIKDAGEGADAEVSNALRQRALGFSRTTTAEVYDMQTHKKVVLSTEKYYPPSEVAAMMWLSNRQRRSGRWHNSSHVDVTNSDGSFGMFASAVRDVDKTLEGKFRVIQPKRLRKDPTP